MLIKVRMKTVEEKSRTTKCEPCNADELPPMDSFYPDTEELNSLPFDTAEFILWISDRPFAEDEVDRDFPPLPFVRLTKNKARFELRNDLGRRLRSSREYPVTLAFINIGLLDARIIYEQRPIYFGISAVTEDHVKAEEHAVADGIDVGDEIGGADALAAFDSFIRDSIRVQRSGRLTSRQIWAVWAALWGADRDDKVIGGVRLTDVSRRFRAVFGVTAVKNPTRIDGIHQRYWDGYTI